MPKASTLTYRRRDDVELREIGDDMFLIDSASERIHHLNLTGAALWRLLAEPLTLREIVEVFREAFPDQTRRLMKKKLKAILEDFADNDLLAEGEATLPAAPGGPREATPGAAGPV